MIVRKATVDDAERVADCLLLAMEDILYNFTQKSDFHVVKELMLHFVRSENNQYSYTRCLVAVHEGKVAGALNYYDGAGLQKLRQPVLDHIRKNFNPAFNPEDETEAGEVYIDSLGVDPQWQGKGVATRLLQHIIDEQVLKQGKTVGLIVEPENERARRLYIRLGFKPKGTKTLAGKTMEHMQVAGSY